MALDISKISSSILEHLHARGFSNEQIAGMTPKQAFNQYLLWDGIIGYARLYDVVHELDDASIPISADASGAQCDRRLAELRDALSEAWIAMNYMGDVLNGCDMTDERDEAVCNPSWERIRELAPFLETIDLDAKYRERHQESLGNCVDCEADIQWCDPYQLLALGEKRCILCSHAKALARRQDEEPQGDTEQPNGRAPA